LRNGEPQIRDPTSEIGLNTWPLRRTLLLKVRVTRSIASHNAWKPRSAEDRLLKQYITSKSGAVYLEVPIGGPAALEVASRALTAQLLDHLVGTLPARRVERRPPFSSRCLRKVPRASDEPVEERLLWMADQSMNLARGAIIQINFSATINLSYQTASSGGQVRTVHFYPTLA